jgi:hypothetical protein
MRSDLAKKVGFSFFVCYLMQLYMLFIYLFFISISVLGLFCWIYIRAIASQIVGFDFKVLIFLVGELRVSVQNCKKLQWLRLDLLAIWL